MTDVMLFEGRPVTVLYSRGSRVRIRLEDGRERTVDASRVKPARTPKPVHAGRAYLAAAAAMSPEARSRLAEAPALRPVPKPPKPLRDAVYLAFVRKHECCVSRDGASGPCYGSVIAHHHGPRGMGEKADDYRTVPLCDGHHREFHDTGTIGAWGRESLDLALAYYMSEQIQEWLCEAQRGRKSGPWHLAIVDALIEAIRRERE
jgi:hypothetical protein